MPDSMPTSPKRSRAEKKEAIIRATSNAVAKKGYAQVSLQDIAQDVGVPKSMLHYYFKDKDTLMMETLRFCNREYITIIEKVAALPLDMNEKVERGLQEFQKFTEQEPTWMMMILDLIIQAVHRPESKKEAALFYEELKVIMAKVLREAKDAKQIKEDFDENVVSILIIATLFGLGVLLTIGQLDTGLSHSCSYFPQMLEGFLGSRKETMEAQRR
jgi:AcrR family transcriptional regulator